MSDVFVSYKAEDRERLRPLVAALEADGLSVWWDAHLGGGDEWRDSIARQLGEARCVIVAWSKRSVASEGRFVRDEAGRAVKRHVYLPVTIDKVDPPLGFGETQCLPLAGWKGDLADPRWQAVRAAVRSRLGLSSGAVATPVARAGRVDRRTVLAGGGVAALAVVGAGGWYLLHGSPTRAASIAVLPFANLSGDASQAYFSDGLAEEVRSALARIPGLHVMARTSSEMLRDADATAAATKLGVATILTGSVRRSPTMIRVSAQLVDGSSGLERWSQTFDRPPGDVLAVQSSIAENVAQQLRGQFGASDRAALEVGGTNNARAQDLILQAQAGAYGDEAGFRQGIALADAAIALDPNYALAYAVKAGMMTSWNATFANTAAQSRAGLAQAAAVARHAISLDPKLAQSHSALSGVLRNQCDMGGALVEGARAVALPGCPAGAVRGHAINLADAGQGQRALGVWRAAAADDPLNPVLIAARAYLFLTDRRYAEAITQYEQALAIEPKAVGTRNNYAIALLFAGRTADAARQFALLPSDDLHRWVGEAAIALRVGDRATAAARFGTLQARYGSGANFQYAQIAAQGGEIDRGIAFLQAAWGERDPGLARIKTDPYIDPLRKDARFGAVVAKLKIPSS